MKGGDTPAFEAVCVDCRQRPRQGKRTRCGPCYEIYRRSTYGLCTTCGKDTVYAAGLCNYCYQRKNHEDRLRAVMDQSVIENPLTQQRPHPWHIMLDRMRDDLIRLRPLYAHALNTGEGMRSDEVRQCERILLVWGAYLDAVHYRYLLDQVNRGAAPGEKIPNTYTRRADHVDQQEPARTSPPAGIEFWKRHRRRGH